MVRPFRETKSVCLRGYFKPEVALYHPLTKFVALKVLVVRLQSEKVRNATNIDFLGVSAQLPVHQFRKKLSLAEPL